jgi:hypothetical protein
MALVGVYTGGLSQVTPALQARLLSAEALFKHPNRGLRASARARDIDLVAATWGAGLWAMDARQMKRP